MSFGYSAGELLGFAQLAWKIVQNSRRACGEHHELTREVKSLHSALKRLEREASEGESAETSTEPTTSKDLKRAIRGCVRVLRELDGILEKYNSLSERELSVKKLLSKVRFGNSEMQELSRFRVKISTYLGIIMLHINVSAGSEMRKMKVSIDGIAARLASGHEGSILTSYGDDDKAAWKELRRGLHKQGFEDSFIRENRHSIMEYVRELGDRGVFDEAGPSVLVGFVDKMVIGSGPEADDCKEEDVPPAFGEHEEAAGTSVDGKLPEKWPETDDRKGEDAMSRLSDEKEAVGPSVDETIQVERPMIDECKDEDVLSVLGEHVEGTGASVDTRTQEQGLETDDFKKKDAMSMLGDDKEVLHGEEGQLPTESKSRASTGAELSQIEDLEQRVDATDHKAEKTSRDDGFRVRSPVRQIFISHVLNWFICFACRCMRGEGCSLACDHIWCRQCLENILFKAALVRPYIRPSCCTGYKPISITEVFPNDLKRKSIWENFSLISSLAAQANRGLVQPGATAEESLRAASSQDVFKALIWAESRKKLMTNGLTASYVEENKKWIKEYIQRPYGGFDHLGKEGSRTLIRVRRTLQKHGFTPYFVETNMTWMLDLVKIHKAEGTTSE